MDDILPHPRPHNADAMHPISTGRRMRMHTETSSGHRRDTTNVSSERHPEALLDPMMAARKNGKTMTPLQYTIQRDIPDMLQEPKLTISNLLLLEFIDY
jgi:hypothetical protein